MASRRMTEVQNVAHSWLINHFECRPACNHLHRYTLVRDGDEALNIDAGTFHKWRYFEWDGELRNALDKVEVSNHETEVRRAYLNPKEYQINLWPHIIARPGSNLTERDIARVQRVRDSSPRTFSLSRWQAWKYLAPAIQYVEDLKRYGIIASSILHERENAFRGDFSFRVSIHPIHNPDIFDPNWKTSTVLNLCQQLVEMTPKGVLKWMPPENRSEIYPILADALQDAGCTNEFWFKDLQSRESAFGNTKGPESQFGEYLVLHAISDLIFTFA